MECRRARNAKEAISGAATHPDLSDLDRIAHNYAVFRDFYLLLLNALSSRARMLQFESLGNISRVQLRRTDSVQELIPLAISTQVLVSWLMSGRADGTPITSEQGATKPLRMELGESEVTIAASRSESEQGCTLSLQLSPSEQLAEAAASVLRDYQRFFVGDPWTPEEPVRLPIKRALERPIRP